MAIAKNSNVQVDIDAIVAATDTLEASAATLVAATDSLETRLPATGYAGATTTVPAGQVAIYDRIGAPAGASLSADLAIVDGIVDNILSQTAAGVVGRVQTFTKTFSSLAANAAAQTIATVTNTVNILSVSLYADGAVHANFTNSPVYFGDTGAATEAVILTAAQTATLASGVLSTQCGSTGCWHGRSGDVMKLAPSGTGSGTTSWRVVIRYEADTSGGALS